GQQQAQQQTNNVNIKINQQTRLDVLHIYPPGTIIEYPDTAHSGRIGHLFELDPTQDWPRKHEFFMKVLLKMLSSWRKQCHIGRHYGEMVVGHPTIPIKPNRKSRLRSTGRVGKKHGMSNKMSADVAKHPRSLVKGWPFIHCKFYDKNGTRDHLLDYSPDAGLYDIDYLRALFNEDREEILAIEEGAKTLGFDPSSHSRTHQNQDGQLELAPMTRLRCSSLFRVYQPLEEYRTVCSKVLVVCSGQHTHPIPLPTKTPPHICNEIFNILHHMDYDLPDLTPRWFLRHPSILKYVESQLSNCHHPTLTDVHISLANRDHLQSYITRVQKLSFPLGTGWRGLLHLKNVHDLELPPEHHYVRLATEFPQLRESTNDQEDEDTLTYCRIFLTHQTAAAHELVFHEINRIVESDTSSPLKWRHLHGTDLDDLTGILQWTGDQHGGQAKVHIFRNIKTSPVNDSVKNIMRSLMSAGKGGHDWVQDKIRSQFAFPALCWSQSFIPRVVWQNGDANSNIIEALHADINSEGRHCSLVHGMKNGLRFDKMKSNSIKICLHYRPLQSAT
ncbi:hypothetical protein BDN67DRAFT_985620, partial [Paxillus ammoniavirescens]